MRTPAAWLRSCKRRTPGWYLFRTRRHRGYGVEFGYLGKSTSLAARKRDHEGTGQWGQEAKPWMDLFHSYHKLTVPWWLGWDWILAPVEVMAIWVLRPRYNDQLNPRRNKVRKREQVIQRAVRDRYGNAPAGMSAIRSMGSPVLVVLGGLIVLAGIAGWLITR